MAIETLHIPAQVVPDVQPRDLEGSFYELLRTRYGIEIATAIQTIEPTVTNEEESAGARRPAALAGLSLRAHEPRRRAAGHWSSSTRSIAATATRSSPS